AVPNLEDGDSHALVAAPVGKGSEHAPGCGCSQCHSSQSWTPSSPIQEMLSQHLPWGANLPGSGHAPGCSCPACVGAAVAPLFTAAPAPVVPPATFVNLSPPAAPSPT